MNKQAELFNLLDRAFPNNCIIVDSLLTRYSNDCSNDVLQEFRIYISDIKTSENSPWSDKLSYNTMKDHIKYLIIKYGKKSGESADEKA